ncbi:glycosyltransferase family 2 protein [Rickettsiales bacterium LUAb2]
MNNKPLLSIIIPTYNNCLYIKNCLDNIKNQSFSDFEVIIINDGSTDNTLELITPYSLEDNRFKLLNQINSGQGVARNLGLKQAVGKYIMFIDSDDYLANNHALEIIINNIQNLDTDILLFGYKKLYNKNICLPQKKHNLILERNVINTIPEKQQLLLQKGIGVPWNKIYKRDFIINNKINFAENLKFEDALFYFLCIVYAKNIGFCNQLLYIYRKHNTSTMRNKYNLNIDLIKIYQLIINNLKNNQLFDLYEDSIILRVAPALKKQFKKTPIKYKHQFFEQLKLFKQQLNLTKPNLQQYSAIKLLKNNNFITFLIKSYI